MARIAVESQAAPAAQGPLEVKLQELVALAMVAGCTAALLYPGILLGAAAAAVWRWRSKPALRARLVCAGAAAILCFALNGFLVCGWLMRNLLTNATPLQVTPVDGDAALRSLLTETLAGPLWLEAALLLSRLRSRTVGAQIRRDHRLDQQRWQAISGTPPTLLATLRARLAASAPAPDHPPGCVRLGTDQETGRPLDLTLPRDLAAHTLLAGASGSGKTTTVLRLADGALANGYAVVIVDCKAGGLREQASELAARYGVPFYAVDPDDQSSLGYDVCWGDESTVANKLLGAFSYSPAAEIYKNIAMEALPVVVRALLLVEEPVTLHAIYEVFAYRGMAKLAKRLPEASATRERLIELSRGDDERTTRSGRAGLQHRLGALLEGRFGRLLSSDDPLSWSRALGRPSVVYIGLSTLASSEDVELMGRVVAQDLKQLCARRFGAIQLGGGIVPVLAVFDEFAALREADQLVDLLLQARQALMPTVVSTQYLPESLALRKACLSAGLLLVHRVEAEDAEAVAAQFGTRLATDVTHQIDYASGFSNQGSIRLVDKYNVHPNAFRNFDVGQLAFKSVPQRRYTIATVFRGWPIPNRPGDRATS